MRHVVLFILLIYIASCGKMDDPINRINSKLKIDAAGGLRKDIPEAYNDSSAYWQYVRRETSRAGLSSIENGSEWIEIRVWEHLDWGRRVVVIRYMDSAWTAENYIYTLLPSGRDDIDSVAVNIVRLGKPKNGWNGFMNKLIDKGILELKDESEIPGYSIRNEFLHTAVEIAAKNYYRYYSLPDAQDVANKIKEAKAMVEILDLIQDEFAGFNRKQ